MKTAISLPDALFEAGERLAARLGLSRSRLYATALTEFLQRHRRDGVTEALDAVYAVEDSTLDPAWTAAQMSALSNEDW